MMTSATSPDAIHGRGALLAALGEELRLYRSLYTLIDGQRDRLQSGRDEELDQVLPEIDRVQARIEVLRETMTQMRAGSGGRFEEWAQSPDVQNAIGQIVNMIRRCRELSAECEVLAAARQRECRRELHDMGRGQRFLSVMYTGGDTPHSREWRP